MFNKIKKNSPLYVNMSNALIKAAQGLSLGEKRLLMLAVSKLDSKTKPTPENMILRITVAEFVESFGVAANTGYEEVKAASEKLMDRRIRFFHEDDEGKCYETRMQWVGRATYAASEGFVVLALWHELSPMLFELKSHFTSYKLSRASALRSLYSWRLFELLMQYKSTGLLAIKTDEFSKTLETPNSYRQDFSLLRTRVIEPAVKEIQEKDGLVVSWEPIKAGRKVKALQFTFKREQKEAKTPKRAPKAPSTPTPIEPVKRSMTKAQLIAELEGFKKLAELARLKGVDKLL